MSARRNKSYALDQCALYHCQTKKKLFELLQTTPTKLVELNEATDLYRPMLKLKKDGTFREIKAPRGDLKRIQKRIGELLLRVATPDYLMAPVRGRSNIDNAAKHRGAASYHLLDVEDFYPRCTANKVAWFFGKVVKCSPDVTAILVRLTTLDGVLPAGSPASPSLAFWAYRDMWDEIDALVKSGECQLTLYVDDITISGAVVPGAIVHAVKERLSHHGHRVKATKEASRTKVPVLVTGVVVKNRTLLMPNSQQLARHLLRKEIEKLPEGRDKDKKLESLAGRDGNETQIHSRNS